jgi:uncharacterized protein YggE
MEHLVCRGRRAGILIVAVLVLMGGALADTSVAHEVALTAPSITVTGHAEVSVAPDLVRVTFAVDSMAPTAAAAAADNRERAERLIASTKEFLRTEGRVSTSGFHLVPVYETPSKRPQQPGEKRTLVGYEVHNEITVELRDLKRTGQLVDAAITSGADRVAGVGFDLSDRRAALQECIGAAGRDATAQAEALAAALGVRLGKIRSVSTDREPIRVPYEGAVGRAVMASAQTPVEPGDVQVAASVHVSYEIME